MRLDSSLARMENTLIQLTTKQEQSANKQEQLATKQDQLAIKQDELATKQDQLATKQDQLSLEQETMARGQEQIPSKEQVVEIQNKVSFIANVQVDLQSRLSEITRLQSHLQVKQDQLASKQDLLHSTIANEQTSASVISSPILSPPTVTYNTWNPHLPRFTPALPNAPYTSRWRSQSCMPTLFTPTVVPKQTTKEESIDDEVFSFLSDFCGSPPSTNANAEFQGPAAPRTSPLLPVIDLAENTVGVDSGLSVDNPSQPASRSSTLQSCGGNAPRPVFQLADLESCGGGTPSILLPPTNPVQYTLANPDHGESAPGLVDYALGQQYSGTGESLPSTSAPLPSSTKLKSPDEIMQSNPELCTAANILKLTVRLAQDSLFGDDVLVRSSVTGKVGFPLDEQKLELLQTVLRTKVYRDMTVESFKELVWPKCKEAIAAYCKRLRKKAKKKI